MNYNDYLLLATALGFLACVFILLPLLKDTWTRDDDDSDGPNYSV